MSQSSSGLGATYMPVCCMTTTFIEDQALFIQGGTTTTSITTSQFLMIDLTQPWDVDSPLVKVLSPNGPNDYQSVGTLTADRSQFIVFSDLSLNVFRYTFATDAWTIERAIPYMMVGPGNAVTDPETGLMYAPNRYNDSTPSMLVYNPLDNSVNKADMHPDLIGNKGFSAVWSTLRKSVLVYGGLKENNTESSVLYEYQPGKGWSVPAVQGDLPGPVYRHRMVPAYGGKVMVLFGGVRSKGEIHFLDTATLTWTTGAPGGPVYAREYPACATSGDMFVVWGGKTATSLISPLNVTGVYNMRERQWQNAFQPPSSVANHTEDPNDRNPNLGIILGCSIPAILILIAAVMAGLVLRKRKNPPPVSAGAVTADDDGASTVDKPKTTRLGSISLLDPATVRGESFSDVKIEVADAKAREPQEKGRSGRNGREEDEEEPKSARPRRVPSQSPQLWKHGQPGVTDMSHTRHRQKTAGNPDEEVKWRHRPHSQDQNESTYSYGSSSGGGGADWLREEKSHNCSDGGLRSSNSASSTSSSTSSRESTSESRNEDVSVGHRSPRRRHQSHHYSRGHRRHQPYKSSPQQFALDRHQSQPPFLGDGDPLYPTSGPSKSTPFLDSPPQPQIPATTDPYDPPIQPILSQTARYHGQALDKRAERRTHQEEYIQSLNQNILKHQRTLARLQTEQERQLRALHGIATTAPSSANIGSASTDEHCSGDSTLVTTKTTTSTSSLPSTAHPHPQSQTPPSLSTPTLGHRASSTAYVRAPAVVISPNAATSVGSVGAGSGGVTPSSSPVKARSPHAIQDGPIAFPVPDEARGPHSPTGALPVMMRMTTATTMFEAPRENTGGTDHRAMRDVDVDGHNGEDDSGSGEGGNENVVGIYWPPPPPPSQQQQSSQPLQDSGTVSKDTEFTRFAKYTTDGLS
ncbi:hypothetical protein DFQ27_006109 [Actinomortierella ambigua]|uniref:Galactose oxidase n=1 Tax=Actinomortierella ambigua TaxID=1343610 RepID=A0A9P6Q037_9FUNG|nr:hypothetical protein DFQ27_006109 [Actinomortierella ambigua]